MTSMNQHQRLQAAYGDGPNPNEIDGPGIYQRLRESGWLPYVATLVGVVLFVGIAASIRIDQHRAEAAEHRAVVEEQRARERGYEQVRASAPMADAWSNEDIDAVAQKFCPSLRAGNSVEFALEEMYPPTISVYQYDVIYQIGLFADRFVC